MKKKEKLTVAVFLVLFLTAAQNILAQQEEFFINPVHNTVGVEVYRRADFSQFKYQWEVISLQNEIIIPLTAISSAQIREKFITSRDEVDLVNSNLDMITIRWNGRKVDGDLPDDGKYFIYVYETAHNDSKIVNRYVYTVTIITEEIYFSIAVESDVINRRTNQKLICKVVPPEGMEQVNAYSWRVEIKNSIDGRVVANQTFKSGQESPFPAQYMWSDYGNLAEEIVHCVITVEAADRAGTKFICQDPIAFTIVDNDEVVYIDYKELMDQLGQIKSENEWLLGENERLLSENERLLSENREALIHRDDSHENKGDDYSWLLALGYEAYTVQQGDYLAKIARNYYGTAYLWGLIYELNKGNFPRPGDADYILPGMKLLLPPASVLENLRDSIDTSQGLETED